MINITQKLLEKIKQHSRQAYPEECCGLLLGEDDQSVKSVRDIRELENNRQGERSRRYLITPEHYKAAEIEAKRKGLEIIGLYHSHPDHPSKPSEFDLAHALPYWSYVIVGVEKGKPGTVSSWVLHDDRSRFEEERLTTREHSIETKAT